MAQIEIAEGTAQRLAIAALLLGAVAVGASAILVRLSDLEALPSAFYRPFLAIPFAWLWMSLDPKRPGTRRPATWQEHLGLLFAGALFAGDLAFWHMSVHHTTVANATLFANTSPIFVVLFGWLLFRQRATRLFLIGLGLALLGAGCLASGSFAVAPANLLGDAYGVATGIFFGSYIIAIGRLRVAFSTAATMLWTSIGSAAVLLPVGFATGDPMLSTSWHGWVVLLALALVSHLLGQGLIVYAVAHLPANFSAVTLLFEPVAATWMAWLILAEAPTAWQFVGGVVILAGIVIARRGRM